MNKVNVKILAMGIAFCLPAVLLAIFGKLEILVMGFMLIYGVLSGGLFYLVCILIGDWKERNSTVVMLDKIEPRFKVGDWVVANYSGKIGQVVAVSEDGYGYQLNDGLCFGVSWCDIFHLWCIKDAKDGDVLASDCSVFIFQKEYIAGKPTAYYGIVEGNFCQGSGGCWTNEQCHPATKEQWDTLRSKMKEAGYEWDSEKKELKEITAPKPEVGDGEEADDKAENWKLTLARQQLKHGAHIWKTPKK